MKHQLPFSTAAKKILLDIISSSGSPISSGLLLLMIWTKCVCTVVNIIQRISLSLLNSQEKKIQKTTGSNESKQSFPLTLRLDHYEGDSVASLSETTSLLPCYSATIWVFTNMSGMLLITKQGCIIDCNSIFAQLALGYTREELVGKVEIFSRKLGTQYPQSHYFSL